MSRDVSIGVGLDIDMAQFRQQVGLPERPGDRRSAQASRSVFQEERSPNSGAVAAKNAVMEACSELQHLDLAHADSDSLDRAFRRIIEAGKAGVIEAMKIK